MHFFQVYQNGAARAFEVYPGANPDASHRFMVYGPRGETTSLPVGNVLLTTDMIVDMGHGREVPPINRSLSAGPRKDARGNRIFDD